MRDAGVVFEPLDVDRAIIGAVYGGAAGSSSVQPIWTSVLGAGVVFGLLDVDRAIIGAAYGGDAVFVDAGRERGRRHLP